MSTLKITKVEGLPYSESELSCHLNLNNTLQEVLTPISADHKVSLPSEGEVKLLFKPTNDENTILGTCTFELKEQESAKIVLNLTTNDDVSEYSGKVFLKFEYNDAVCELNQESVNVSVCDEEIEYPRLKLQLKMQTFSLQEISLELQSTKQKLCSEVKARQGVDEKLQETLKEYSQFVNMAQSREKSMLKLLEQKDVEIAENINQTLKLQGYLDRLLEDKRHVEEKLAFLKTVAANDEAELLRQQVSKLKSQLAQEDKRRQELQEMLLQIGKEWRETEDQEKINVENKMIKAEQEILRSNAHIQDLQVEIQRYKSTQDKNAIELQILKQELDRKSSEKTVNEAEICELKTKLSEYTEKCAGLEDIVQRFKGEIVEVYSEKEKMAGLIANKDQQIAVLEKTLQTLTVNLNEEKDSGEKLTEKLQQEKIYSDRLNDQIIQERITVEKYKKEALGPDLETLIEDSFRSAKLENSLLKVGESYFYDGVELQINKKTEHGAEVRVANSKDPFVGLYQFLTCPKISNLKKKCSQDSRIESENEAVSVFSVDKEKGMFCSDKMEKRDLKAKGTKLINKPSMKLPLKDKNFRVGSASVERKRPFK